MGLLESAATPYLGMVLATTAQVGLIIISKKAMATGMTTFTFVAYSNALASLILLPLSLVIHRSSSRPPLTVWLICGFFMLGVFGCSAQLTGYTGINLTNAAFASAMLNLIPGFTFILALISGFLILILVSGLCLFFVRVFLFQLLNWDLFMVLGLRMEKLVCRSSSFMAKAIGTVVSITGAFIVTLYEGPQILAPLSSSESNDMYLQSSQSNWIVGGLFLAVDCALSSGYIIVQALILKKYPAELIVVFFYCFFAAILSIVASLIVDNDLSAWALQPNIRLIAVLYSGVFGSAFQVGVTAWCLGRKGPLFVAVFHPLSIVIAAAMGFLFLGDILYLGSLMGSIIIVVGFYSVMWGKAKEILVIENGIERSSESTSEKAPLLPIRNDSA